MCSFGSGFQRKNITFMNAKAANYICASMVAARL
jgi:hypothetical protein